MGFGDVFKGLLLPGLIALALYTLITYLILPLYRSHRARYAQYLPLQTLTSTSTTLRDRVSAAVGNFMLPREVGRRGSASGSEFGEEEGESMVGFDFRPGRDGWGQRRVEMDSQRRLSRDLEEGFKDDSEDEEGEGDDRRRTG